MDLVDNKVGFPCATVSVSIRKCLLLRCSAYCTYLNFIKRNFTYFVLNQVILRNSLRKRHCKIEWLMLKHTFFRILCIKTLRNANKICCAFSSTNLAECCSVSIYNLYNSAKLFQANVKLAEFRTCNTFYSKLRTYPARNFRPLRQIDVSTVCILFDLPTSLPATCMCRT